jgi:1-aminocyclopropane-1-carboxylate deaminase/D-cysteine desulfhydrase-like pyridoxal-dependent ACC family enzyme
VNKVVALCVSLLGGGYGMNVHALYGGKEALIQSELKPGIYRHYKGKYYEVMGVGHHTETLEKLVFYRALYDTPDFGERPLWVRPLAMFCESTIFEGKETPRFSYVGEVPSCNDRACIDVMKSYLPFSLSTRDSDRLYQEKGVASSVSVQGDVSDAGSCALFKAYPVRAQKLKHVSLGALPTPVRKLEALGKALGHDGLYIKCDDYAGRQDKNAHHLFGGNKIRKLEFLLADARARGAKAIVTLGAAGSNHIVTTAAYARQLGLECHAFMRPQVNSSLVKRNIVLGAAFGTIVHYYPSKEALFSGFIEFMLEYKKAHGAYPYVLVPGGSQSLGALGFVNAAFELKEQIKAGLLSEPDFIYITHGSAGSFVGLELGVRAAGLKTKIIGIADEEKIDAAYERTVQLFNDTNQLLVKADPSFPRFNYTRQDMTLLCDYYGAGYGYLTETGAAAIKLLQETEGILLDQTYSAKGFSALLEHIQSGALKGKTVLFWNTFCGLDFSHITSQVDINNLPKDLQSYFEKK